MERQSDQSWKDAVYGSRVGTIRQRENRGRDNRPNRMRFQKRILKFATGTRSPSQSLQPSLADPLLLQQSPSNRRATSLASNEETLPHLPISYGLRNRFYLLFRFLSPLQLEHRHLHHCLLSLENASSQRRSSEIPPLLDHLQNSVEKLLPLPPPTTSNYDPKVRQKITS